VMNSRDLPQGCRYCIGVCCAWVASIFSVFPVLGAPSFNPDTFTDQYCSACHNDEDKSGHLDLTTLGFIPNDADNFTQWVKVYDRLQAGEMPPRERKNRPAAAELEWFLTCLATSLSASEKETIVAEGRATQRRLNGYEYENTIRDLLSAPWLQIRAQLPVDGEAFRFNKHGDALDVSPVHMARYLNAANYAIRQVMSTQFERPPSTVHRYYARDQRSLTGLFTPDLLNSSPDRMTYPVVGVAAQPDVRSGRAPLTTGFADPKLREAEAVGWVSSNYAAGFNYRWDGFRAPVAGRYRIRFCGYTLWVAPGGVMMRFADAHDKVGTPRPRNPNLPDYDRISPGRRNEPITVYTRNGIANRRVGEFDLTPEPAVHELGEVWLLANETLVPDASRFFRSRPSIYVNPLMTPEGAPSVAFRWMEVEGPINDDATNAGYRLLFGDLPLRKVTSERAGGVELPVTAKVDPRGAGRKASERIVPMETAFVEVVSSEPKRDAGRLIRAFVRRAYRRPVDESCIQRFIRLVEQQLEAGRSFTEAMLAGYTAVLASPGFLFLTERPGQLDDYALATRLSLFLWNSAPDLTLRARAQRSELHRPDVLRTETERMLADPKSRRFVDAFLDYWLDLRKMEDSTPSTTLYNDYYLDDALAEAALAETQLFFGDLLQRDLPVRNLVDSDFTFLNERLALHYNVSDVHGIAMRRVALPVGGPRGGIVTQASVLKVTANGTTTSPVLRGKWLVERILGVDIPPPPPVAAIEPDIRGTVTIRQQLAKHRNDPSCASCHRKMDPAGFALENFDVMGGWRDHYRVVDEKVPPEKGIGKNGHAFAFHFGPRVDSSGELPDGRSFQDIREFKKLLIADETALARNLVRQLIVYATGAPVRFSDRPMIEKIIEDTKRGHYGVRTLIHQVVQSDLFRQK